MEMSGGIRRDNSKFLLKISFISNGRFKGALQANPVVGVNPFPKYVQGGISGLRIKTENSEMLLRPRHFSCRCIPSPTPCITEPLTFCKKRLTTPDGIFRKFMFRNIRYRADNFFIACLILYALTKSFNVF